MHKKVMQQAASRLKKDAKSYLSKMKNETSSSKKRKEKQEAKEALAASKDLTIRAKKAHGK